MSSEASHDPRRVPQVMVSSTFIDLKGHREALINAIHQNKLHANVMENDSAKLVDVIESSLQMVCDSAAYIGIISLKYGQTPPCRRRNPDGLSITELEFNEAQRMGRPILLFIMGEDHDVKKRDIEQDAANLAKLNAFRERAKQWSAESSVNRVYAVFNSLDEFKEKIRPSLAELHRHLDFQATHDKPASEPTHAKEEFRSVEFPSSAFRYVLDRHFCWLVPFLTKVGLLKPPQEWSTLNNYITGLRAEIYNGIQEKTYVPPHGVDVTKVTRKIKAKGKGFLTPIQQFIKEVVGISHGGDAQSARLSAISKKSKRVRNIVNRLLTADEPLILLGDPGTGKSITLQQAAMEIAEVESKRHFPTVCVFVRLGEFQLPAEMDNRQVTDVVFDFVKRFTPPEVRPFIESLDAAGRLVIFFDGMDEMSRDRYDARVTALSVFAGRKGHAKSLFSCRITDFTPRFQHHRLVVLPFTRRHIRRYLNRQLTFPLEIEGEQWSVRQLSSRLAQGELPMQADNPFVLWLFCHYLQEESRWPKSRVALLESYSRQNYGRKTEELRKRGQAMPDPDIAFVVWGQIAHEITARNAGTSIPLDEVTSLLDEGDHLALDAAFVCGVLQKSLDLDKPLVRFEHHRFQEFFTALYLNRDERTKATINWLGRLDAPRWQETLLNLVLMGGGTEALIALESAIKIELDQHQGKSFASSRTSAQAETRLADRVELASRVLQQAQQQSAVIVSTLTKTFTAAVYWLARAGNPITQVKMLWASQAVEGTDIFRVARKPLASKLSWVRQQALVVTSAERDGVGSGALQEEVLHSFASGYFANQLGGFFRIASALKQKRLWCVLTIGLLLSVLLSLTSFEMVEMSRTRILPAYIKIIEFQQPIFRLLIEKVKRDARVDPDSVERLAKIKVSDDEYTMQINTFFAGVQNVLTSIWFRLVLNGAMLLTLIYVWRHAAGKQFLAAQAVGLITLSAPCITYSLWPSKWILFGNFALDFILLVLPIVIVTNLVLALLFHVLALATFVASASLLVNAGSRRRSLFESMWENCGFRRWGTTVTKICVIAFTLRALLSAAELFAGVEWDAFWNSVVRFCWFPVLPPAINFALSLAIYLQIMGALFFLAAILKQKQRRSWPPIRILRVWTMFIVGSLITGGMIWWILSIGWRILLNRVAASIGLFKFCPSFVNVALSGIVYAEIVGILVTAMRAIIRRPEGGRLATALFCRWTAWCSGLFIVSATAWRAWLINWRAVWTSFASHLGFFPLLSTTVNIGLTMAIYVEITGFIVSFAVGLAACGKSQSFSDGETRRRCLKRSERAGIFGIGQSTLRRKA